MSHRMASVRQALRTDVSASLAVLLVAVPLCVGIAVASGVPAELGMITGIIGGLVTGLLPGSSLQVSGPAAGLTVLVAEAVDTYGLAALGLIVLSTGVLQLALGALRLGGWFRAISVSVVEGMLAGIGLMLILGQLYALADRAAPSSGIGAIAGLPAIAGTLFSSATMLTAFALGTGSIAVIVLWRRLPARFSILPGALVAVVLASAVTAVFDLPVATVKVSGLLDAIHLPGPGAGRLVEPGMITTVLAFTLIASAASLFSASAVDRLHDGPRTQFDKELMAQGVGNMVCGVFGALPITAVMVRSATNVQAGARTKASRVLHGLWLLLFAALFPSVLGLIPITALAGVLIHAGFVLLPVRYVVSLWREHRGEAVILLITTTAIVTVSMFEGVLIGLALSIVKSAWETSHIQLHTIERPDGRLLIQITGNATFLRLPKILDSLDALPADRPVELDLTGLRHQDHACTVNLLAWAEQHNSQDPGRVQLTFAG